MIWVFLVVPFLLVASETPIEPEYLDQLLASGNDVEFAKLMGIDVSLVRPSDERSEGSIMNMALPLGDILLTREQQEQARQGIDFIKWEDSQWPNGEMAYVINRDHFTKPQFKIIQTAIANFNANVTNLQLVPRWNQPDYVYVFSGNGCYSYLGRIRNYQPLSLQQNGCVWHATVQHELMHAAGFAHEHNREDRDDYVEILYDNIPPEWHSQYEKVNSDDFNMQGQYNYYSVMHYPLRAPGTGLPAFKVLQDGIDEDQIGRAPAMSDMDVKKIDDLYS